MKAQKSQRNVNRSLKMIALMVSTNTLMLSKGMKAIRVALQHLNNKPNARNGHKIL